jgi:hypothetical protein
MNQIHVTVCFHRSASLAKATRDDPPSFIAATAPSLIPKTRSLNSFPVSDSIKSLTRFSNSPALTNPFSDSFVAVNATATFISLTINTLFIFCSAYRGHAIIGTPANTASSTEFHPQCVTNPPTESWLSTSICGIHDFTTRPFSFVLSRKPCGNSSSKLGSSGVKIDWLWLLFSTGGACTTHRNPCPQFSNPVAIVTT